MNARALAWAALAVWIVLCAAAPAGAQVPEPPSITVTGSASVSAPPDTAEVTAGVVTQGATAAQALGQNNAAMERVLKALTALGIPEKDVQTRGLSVVPQRASPRDPQRPQPPTITGYEVTNQVHVKVRDLAGLGRLLDVLVMQGANVLGGVAFSIADPSALLDQARARAIADAHRKAQIYAGAAGVKLGKVIYIRDASPGMPRPVAMRMAAASPAGVPVAPGEQEIEASVSVTYGIE